MTTDFFDLSQDLATPRPTWPHRTMAGIRTAIAGFIERRRQKQTLSGLSDHILRDIGIEPAEVRGATHGRIPPILPTVR